MKSGMCNLSLRTDQAGEEGLREDEGGPLAEPRASPRLRNYSQELKSVTVGVSEWLFSSMCVWLEA